MNYKNQMCMICGTDQLCSDNICDKCSHINIYRHDLFEALDNLIKLITTEDIKIMVANHLKVRMMKNKEQFFKGAR